MKKSIIGFAILALVIVGAGFYFAFNMFHNDADLNQGLGEQGAPTTTTPTTQVNNATSTSQENKPSESSVTGEINTNLPDNKTETIIGKSVDGRNIVAYHFGSGTDKEILLVGGIHGGYAWNTALLGYQMMDYFKANPSAIPANIKLTIVPALNPDGLSKVVSIAGAFKAADVSTSQTAMTAGRFNANTVDLNRNFDCGWKASGVWQSKTVSGGTSAFSEPESAAIRDYAQANKITAVVAWYSAGGGVYISECDKKILPESEIIMNLYARLSGYSASEDFNAYSVSGDMTDWFSKNNVPAIGVLLTTHTDTELDKNLAGIKELLKHYAQ